MTQPKNGASPTTQITKSGLLVDGQRTHFLSASVHYWRLKRELWPALLDKVLELGFTWVCSYVPWSVHELARGHFDFEDQKDLMAFAQLCADRQLRMMLRPGPHINAEITGFGYPQRILADPEIMARGPTGAPIVIPAPPQGFHVPSYASQKFWDELALFFDALKPLLAKLVAPHGPVYGLQADNEHSFFFRTTPTDQDYHPEALSAYRSFLKTRYQQPARYQSLTGLTISDFSEAQPPKEMPLGGPKKLRHCVDWLEFKEKLARDSTVRVAKELRARLPEDAEVFFFHNYPPSDLLATPFDVYAMEQEIDIQGIDFYPARRDHAFLARQCRTLLGLSRLPFIPEFGAGSCPWIAVVTFEDQKFTTPYCFMQGIVGMNFYMAVQRERWYGSPITEDNRFRPEQKPFFQSLLQAFKDMGMSSLETPSTVLLLASQAYQRQLQASYLFTPLPSLALLLMGHDSELMAAEYNHGLGPEERPLHMAWDQQFRAWTNSLLAQNLPFRLAEGAWPRAPEQRALVLVPSYEYLEQAVVERLLEWQEQGSTIIMGPECPSLDEDFQEGGPAFEKLRARIDEGAITLLKSTDAVSLEAHLEAFKEWWSRGFEGLQTCLKRSPEGQEWLFVANVEDEPRRVTCPPALRAREPEPLWGRGRFEGEEMCLEAYSVWILKLGAG